MSTEEQVARWIRDARYGVALTGAGVSTESGIPDFRGPNGVWTKNPGAERLSNIHAYLADPATRAEVWQMRISHPAWTAAPNAGHLALVDLERRGHLKALITQNIDGLHAIAGSSAAALIEMHGTMREVTCLSCGDRGPAQPTFARVLAGDPDPACLQCGGILKSATISFGQSLLAGDLHRAEVAASSCDLMIAIGSSLLVYPVAVLPQVALECGARLVIINAEPTPYDERAAVVLREPIGEVLPRIAAQV
ncbi:MAG: SIR2 family NAD-dependent protein deacylase [Actinomycetota bacterium]